ncbi:hypothetical protein QAD02_008094, partial [Eretmocerus hayati]
MSRCQSREKRASNCELPNLFLSTTYALKKSNSKRVCIGLDHDAGKFRQVVKLLSSQKPVTFDADGWERFKQEFETVPWDALIRLMSESIYGGKIDNDFDQRLLSSFLRKLFTPRSFEADFALVANVDGVSTNNRHILMPDGTRRDQFLKWIESISDRQTPSWLGLPNNAEKVLLTTKGVNLVTKLLKMQQLEDEDELAYCNDDTLDSRGEAESDGRPAWMRTLHKSASTWLQLLPKCLIILKRTAENIRDPLYRFFEREINSCSKLLKEVIHDLEDVVMICQGEKKQTNYHRIILSDLIKGILPTNWRRYTVPKGCTVIQWVTDFSHRVSQLQEVSGLVSSSGAKGIQ